MHNTGKSLLLALLILLLAIFFRFWSITQTPPGLYPDEAINGNNAVYAADTADFKPFYQENNGREGLYMNITALSIRYFGLKPWAIRLVSAIFGSLTVLGMFYLGRELFRKIPGEKIAGLYPAEITALSASFFTAVSFWHINFSRVGFRAIMAPFFLVWGLYFLWLLLRDDLTNAKKVWASVFGGLFFGLGVHSYIAYRIAPLLLILPFVKILKNKNGYKQIAVFALFAFIAFLPLGIYYLENPADFFGRTSQISIFSEPSPIKSFFINSARTIGSFWFLGDWNPRHNFPGQPLLWWPVGILFAVGLARGVTKYGRELFTKTLWLWFLIFSLPVVLSSEGLPHALRSIIMIPAVMFFAGFGFWVVIDKIRKWLMSKIGNFPERGRQLLRIKFELLILLAVFLSAHIVITYNDYFVRWAGLRDTRYAFSADYAEIGNWLKDQDAQIPKYVVINAGGVLVPRPDNSEAPSIPMPSQTVMFLTDTWPEKKGVEKNLYYILPENLKEISCKDSCVVVALEHNPEIASKIKSAVDGLSLSVSPGFPVFYKNTKPLKI